jgi:hypothetical protein
MTRLADDSAGSGKRRGMSIGAGGEACGRRAGGGLMAVEGGGRAGGGTGSRHRGSASAGDRRPDSTSLVVAQ